VIPLERLIRETDSSEGQESTVRLSARAELRATVAVFPAAALKMKPSVVLDTLTERAEREEFSTDSTINEPHSLNHLGSRDLSAVRRLRSVVLDWSSRRCLPERS
tara:strand:- start:118 stop:432 length:315 start_codon:yes stop_codon:yes gene_type:complete